MATSKPQHHDLQLIDWQSLLTAERLRDELTDLREHLRTLYPDASRQVAAEEPRKLAERLAETWLIELATDHSVEIAIGSHTLADLNLHFQRILTFAEQVTTRSRYDRELQSILTNYSLRVILPIKRSKYSTPRPVAPVEKIVHSAFVGQSFTTDDSQVNRCVFETLSALGIDVITGEKPRAGHISEKVKHLIEQQSFFVGIFTRRDKIARKSEWSTSTWVIDEKAYALGRNKQLVLIKEKGVGSVGGIQGDQGYLEFSRDSLELLAIQLVQLFELTNNGLRTLSAQGDDRRLAV